MKDGNTTKINKSLINLSCADFVEELSGASISPGGGSVSAFSLALSAGLTSMVASLTYRKKGYKHSEKLMTEISARSQQIKDRALILVDEDTSAFKNYLEAGRLGRQNEAAEKIRAAAIEEAAKQITLVPLETLRLAAETAEMAERLLKNCLLSARPDAESAVLQAVAAASGSYINVRNNLQYIKDRNFAGATAVEAEKLFSQAHRVKLKY